MIVETAQNLFDIIIGFEILDGEYFNCYKNKDGMFLEVRDREDLTKHIIQSGLPDGIYKVFQDYKSFMGRIRGGKFIFCLNEDLPETLIRYYTYSFMLKKVDKQIYVKK